MTTQAKPQLDYSTIDLDALYEVSGFTDWREIGGQFRPSPHLGAGCYGDPPGYPTYFLQSSLRDSVNGYFIHHPVHDTWHYFAQHEDCYRLYKPLPFDHPRVQQWVVRQFQHFKRCYIDTTLPEDQKMQAGTYLFWPWAEWDKVHFAGKAISSGWYREKGAIERAERDLTPEEYGGRMADWLRRKRATEQAAIDAEIARLAAICVPDNHAAVRSIRKVYPDFVPDMAILGNLPIISQADWWERLTKQPMPADCQPPSWWTIQSNRHHNTGLCRWCGATDNVPQVIPTVPLQEWTA